MNGDILKRKVVIIFIVREKVLQGAAYTVNLKGKTGIFARQIKMLAAVGKGLWQLCRVPGLDDQRIACRMSARNAKASV